jgi:CheY-like chemotaxis protein
MAQHLLIIDDEPDMLTLLKRSLEPELGCRVDNGFLRGSRSGNDAHQRLRPGAGRY